MKALTVFLLISFTAAVQANCKVDPSKVILFVDTNESDLEIATAEKAACSRGERVVVVPKNYKDYRKYTEVITKTRNDLYECEKAKKPCVEVYNKMETALVNLDKFRRTQPDLQKAIKQSLAEIKEKKGKIQSLIISGHNGGGSFGGNKGSFGRQELNYMMEDLKDINEIKSVLLLGCYTGVQKEVMEWKKMFPDVRMIAGYDDSAPLSHRPQGHKFLSELLLKEKGLASQADAKKLQSYAQANLSSLFTLNSGLYLQCVDPKKNETEYYYGSKKKTKKFSVIDMEACKDQEKIKDLAAKVSKYYNGELEVPENTSSGELRQLYNLGRSLEHCFDPDAPIVNMNNVFNLLFYEGVKKSFAHHYKNDLETVEKNLQELTVEMMEANADAAISKTEKEYEKVKLKLEAMEKDPQGYLNSLEKAHKESREELEKFKSSPAFESIKQFFLPNGEFNYDSILPETPEVKAAYREYNAKRRKIRDVEYSLKDEKDFPGRAIRYAKEDVKDYERSLMRLKANKTQIPENFQKIKEMWIPTASNLTKKTRKETLENMHKIGGIIDLPYIPGKYKSQLYWLNSVTSNHLQHFQNPFSWHEFNGSSVERPQRDTALSRYYDPNAPDRW